MNTTTQPRTKKQIAQELYQQRHEEKQAAIAGLLAMLENEKAEAAEAAKKPPADFQKWGVTRTRAWVARRCSLAKLLGRKNPATQASITKRIDLIALGVAELRRVARETTEVCANIANPPKKERPPAKAPRTHRGGPRHEAAR